MRTLKEILSDLREPSHVTPYPVASPDPEVIEIWHPKEPEAGE